MLTDVVVAVVVTFTVVVMIVTVANTGNSGRLMEMLHGSDGWGKLVSELQQKEEADAQQAAVQADQQQQPPPNRRKRGRPPKDGSDPLVQATRLDCLLLQMFPLLQGGSLSCKAGNLLADKRELFACKLHVLVIRHAQQIQSVLRLSSRLCCHMKDDCVTVISLQSCQDFCREWFLVLPNKCLPLMCWSTLVCSAWHVSC